MLQLTGERWADGKTEAELKSQMANELADIMAEALFIASELNIDMAKPWEDMLADDTKKISERS